MRGGDTSEPPGRGSEANIIKKRFREATATCRPVRTAATEDFSRVTGKKHPPFVPPASSSRKQHAAHLRSDLAPATPVISEIVVNQANICNHYPCYRQIPRKNRARAERQAVDRVPVTQSYRPWQQRRSSEILKEHNPPTTHGQPAFALHRSSQPTGQRLSPSPLAIASKLHTADFDGQRCNPQHILFISKLLLIFNATQSRIVAELSIHPSEEILTSPIDKTGGPSSDNDPRHPLSCPPGLNQPVDAKTNCDTIHLNLKIGLTCWKAQGSGGIPSSHSGNLISKLLATMGLFIFLIYGVYNTEVRSTVNRIKERRKALNFSMEGPEVTATRTVPVPDHRELSYRLSSCQFPAWNYPKPGEETTPSYTCSSKEEED
ncbi:adhesion G-protein coupled receptor D2 isoform X1 [Lates japonicus]|uniref:Adhesion G-protein coupled receptor D2 isoform X1 n=1 Tax=Lates japonicus TaxID=270547 RepID=A0AAD3NH77_LATJO|nr:adhesion G-protein coupled receptor D2 isoform X1 [Lates japonicus]